MDISSIISEIDGQIGKLQQARALLSNETVKKGPGRPKSQTSELAPVKLAKKRTLSPEARKRIADAQKARWAATKRTGSK